MRLTDLQPKWIYKSKIFAFLCPHCKKDWLTCKRVVMSHRQQREIVEIAFGEGWSSVVVLCEDACAWAFTSFDFETISVTPSLDASKSGNWHGHITNGVIVGGVQA